MVDEMRNADYGALKQLVNSAAGKEVCKDQGAFISNLGLIAVVEERDDEVTRFIPVDIKWRIYRLMYPEATFDVDFAKDRYENKDILTATVKVFRTHADMKDAVHSALGIKSMALDNIPVFSDVSERLELWKQMTFKSALSKALDLEGVAPWVNETTPKGDGTVPAPVIKPEQAASQQAPVKEKPVEKQRKEASKAPAPAQNDDSELPISSNIDEKLEAARGFVLKQRGEKHSLGEYEKDNPRKLISLYKWQGASDVLKDAIRTIVVFNDDKFREIYEELGLTKEDF